MRVFKKYAWWILPLGVIAGCGQSEADDIRSQESNLRARYENSKQENPKLTAKAKRIHQARLRMQYGDAAE